MSVVLKKPDGQLILYTKGADSIIYQYCLSNNSKASRDYEQTQRSVNECAVKGLRTLFLAQKEIDEADWAQWNERQIAAKASLANRDEEVMNVDNEIEVGMELIGATAIEDKL